MNNIKIIDNFLEESDIKNIQKVLLGETFPWYFLPYISYETEKEKNLLMYQFTHILFPKSNEHDKQSVYHYLIDPILKKIDHQFVTRIKCNLNVYLGGERIEDSFHTDVSGNGSSLFKSCIFYVNDNNGYTKFENNQIVESKSNRVCIFNSSIPHTVVTQTNTKQRVVINFIYH
jgi:hypothetical protein